MNRKFLLLSLVISFLTLGLVLSVLDSHSQEPDQNQVSGSETTFSYQGYLSSGSSPAEGNYDFSFTLNNSLADGLQVGPTLVLDDVNVSGGKFSVQLDFGDVFDGTPFWLEIGVSSDKDSEPYTFLSPRHVLGASPYAAYAYRSSWSGVEGIPADLADGDNDALAILSCSPGQVPEWDGANWVCAADDDTLAGLSCAGDKILRRSGSTWICDDDRDTDTTYTAGDGLEQAGTSFAISSTYQLPQACDPGQITEWNGVFWDCGEDDLGEGGGGGTITGVFGGNGLIGAATSGSVTLHAGEGTGIIIGADSISVGIPYRLPQSCANEEVAQWNNTLSEWQCDPDDDELANLGCSGGEVPKWDGTNSVWLCAEDIDTVDDTVSYSEISGIVNITAGSVAAGDHDHSGVYAPDSHDHDGSYFTQAELIAGTADVHWGNLNGVPGDLDDGDDDTLAGLSCETGKILRYSGSTWVCDDDQDSNTTYTAGEGLHLTGTSFAISSTYRLPQSCAAGEIAQWNESLGEWECDPDDDWLGQTSCTQGQVVKWDQTAGEWLCAGDIDTVDDTVSYAEIAGIVSTTAGSVAAGDHGHDDSYYTKSDFITGTAVIDWSKLIGLPTGLADGDDDTLVDLACDPDDIVRQSESGWFCDADRDNDTTYTAGEGLLLQGTSFAISSTFQLPQGCAAGKIPEWNGVFWDCSDDDVGTGGGGGTITGVFGGEGLIGGADTGSVTLHVGAGEGLQSEEDYVFIETPYKLPQSCSDGQIPQWNQSLSQWDCDPDDDTLATTICADGQVLKWEEGAIFCADDAADDIVSYDEIFEIVGPGPGMVAAGEHDHDVRYFTQVDLLTPASGAGIVWENVFNVPLDLEDGDQDTLTSLSCAEGQVAKWNATTTLWECASDEQGLGGLTCSTGQLLEYNGVDWVCVDPATGWSLTGNSGTVNGSNYLGTSDAVSLTLAVSGTAALRLEPTTWTPNLIGGSASNQVQNAAFGVTIGGGGSSIESHVVSEHFGTIGGGTDNTIGDGDGDLTDGRYGTVSGGAENTASSIGATVGGGVGNSATNVEATIAGGLLNQASGYMSAIGGGSSNIASNFQSTVAGGVSNLAHGNQATIGGGELNRIITSTQRATISGGAFNVITGTYGTIGGGYRNTITGTYGTVGGGTLNRALNEESTVGGGYSNQASGFGSTVGGGSGNQALGNSATIAGGTGNIAYGSVAFIGSGYSNQVIHQAGTVAGGQNNLAGDPYGTVGGGQLNYAYGQASTIGGGNNNVTYLNADYATISGGQANWLTGTYGTVGGGTLNSALANYVTISGGISNTITGTYGTVGGGYLNKALNDETTVGGGYSNQAIGFGSTVGGGSGNQALGNSATIAGGTGNIAYGSVAFIGSGYSNQVIHQAGTVAGGQNNLAGDPYGTVGGGQLNYAYGQASTIGGGNDNVTYLNADYATISGGRANWVTGTYGTVGGGYLNQALNDETTVGGGYSNQAIGFGSTVGGGSGNQALGNSATIAGGTGNIAYGSVAFIGSGYSNQVIHQAGTVAGGQNNLAGDPYGTVGGGQLNYAYGQASTIGGGNDNVTYLNADYATISGGRANWVTGTYGTAGGGYGNAVFADFATIAGGGPSNPTENPTGSRNQVTDNYGTIGGGGYNQVGNSNMDREDAFFGTVAGGKQNSASGAFSTVGGGLGNSASYTATTVAGGQINLAGHHWATVGGGYFNWANGDSSTVAGGYDNTVERQYGTIAGGDANYVHGDAGTIGGGAGNYIGGAYGTVPGGNLNNASGDYSFAAGRQATAANNGCFVWGDGTSSSVSCNNDNRWVVQASGGVYFYSNSGLTSGTFLAAGANSWSSVSDRASKENFLAANTGAILEAVASMPLYDYNLKSQDPSVRHLGPVAQDFHAAFDFGENELAINMQDADGVALASIQALYERSLSLESENAELTQQLTELEIRLAAVEKGNPAGQQPVILYIMFGVMLLLMPIVGWLAIRVGVFNRSVAGVGGGS